MRLKLDHLNIVVADMGRAEEFYGGLLGLEKTFDTVLKGAWIEQVSGLPQVEARCVFFEFGGGGPRLELLQYLSPSVQATAAVPPANMPGLRHIAFEVADIDAFVRKLHGAGVATQSPPIAVPFAVNGGKKRLCYFHDPDGTLLEVAEYRPA